ncbi:potassium channel family protein [Desulfovibrio inopinatus]|uniref:potassium channel family protein n=1 Tax=Desulfovibrio inopinatus TaxID=102109 RepID=UPI0003F5EF43|nr:TrkA family potassium uptake protein [Desulfovibrio inopinatus]
MPSKLQMCVIGLGKFGYHTALTLAEMGHEVMGLDMDPEKIRRAQNVLTQVFRLDGMEKKALEQVGVADMHHVIVSVGQSLEASTLISLYLKELGVEDVWVKAISDDHEKLLRKIGVDEVIFPERYAAVRLAHRLSMPGLVDMLPYGDDIVIREILVEHWAGKSLRELNLTNRHGVQVIAVKSAEDHNFHYVPRADKSLVAGDMLIVVGNENVLKKLDS